MDVVRGAWWLRWLILLVKNLTCTRRHARTKNLSEKRRACRTLGTHVQRDPNECKKRRVTNRQQQRLNAAHGAAAGPFAPAMCNYQHRQCECALRSSSQATAKQYSCKATRTPLDGICGNGGHDAMIRSIGQPLDVDHDGRNSERADGLFQ